MSPRGYNVTNTSKLRTGNKAIMGTLEMRAPIIPLSVFEVLKVLKLEKPTAVLFTDLASVWNPRSRRSIETAGIEFVLQ